MALVKRAEAERRIADLRDQIRRHDHLYYVKGAAEIPDQDYDRIYRELVDLEGQFPELVTPTAPPSAWAGRSPPSFRLSSTACPC